MTILNTINDYNGDPMKWNIAQAKKMFSDLIHRVPIEPQMIYNRSTMVAVVISPEDYQQLQSVKVQAAALNLASSFEEFRKICQDERYSFELPERRNREVTLP